MWNKKNREKNVIFILEWKRRNWLKYENDLIRLYVYLIEEEKWVFWMCYVCRELELINKIWKD